MRRFSHHGALLSAVAVLLGGATACGDIVVYDVPNLPIQVTLQGTYRVNPGGTVTFRHRLGTLYFALGDTKRYKLDSTTKIGRRMLLKAKGSKDVTEVLNVANWELHHGMLPEFYDAIEIALQVDPQNDYAQRIKDLQEKMATPLAFDPKLEQILRQEVPDPKFTIDRSDHFIMLHDTPKKKGRKNSRAQERLDLLEAVYEVFLLKFYWEGDFRIEIPDKRLMVLLFDQHEEFKNYGKSIDEALIHADGFWSPSKNISVFYDHGTSTQYEGLRELGEKISSMARDARRSGKRSGDLVRTANTIDLLVEITQENSDITVVSHEATHQMAGNTGLFPRDVNIPRWVHEGLAAYFEAPNDSLWAGIGAVNKERIDWYRALAANDREHSSLDFIVGDQIFNYAGDSHDNLLHAYGQAWALTHFLAERHFKELVDYYGRLGEFPADTPISAATLNELFDEVFGGDREGLEREWRKYMEELKTDMEILLEGLKEDE